MLVLGCSAPGEGALRSGKQAAARGDYPAAVTLFTQATKEAPRNAEAQAMLGNALFAGGKADGAASAWGAAIALDNHSPDALLGLARVALGRGEPGAALAHLDGVTERRSDEKALRAVVLLARGQEGDAAAALVSAEKALQLEADSADALYAAGCAALALRNDAVAQRHFDRLLRQHPASELGPIGLARLAAARSQRTDVILYLRAARKALGPRWQADRVLSDRAFLFLAGDAEFVREIGEP